MNKNMTILVGIVIFLIDAILTVVISSELGVESYFGMRFIIFAIIVAEIIIATIIAIIVGLIKRNR